MQPVEQSRRTKLTLMPRQVYNKLLAEFQREPYPSAEELARIAKEVAAPGPTQVCRARVQESRNG